MWEEVYCQVLDVKYSTSLHTMQYVTLVILLYCKWCPYILTQLGVSHMHMSHCSDVIDLLYLQTARLQLKPVRYRSNGADDKKYLSNLHKSSYYQVV